MKSGSVRETIELDPEVHEALTRIAKASGKPVSEVVNDVVRSIVGKARPPFDPDLHRRDQPKTGIGMPSLGETERSQRQPGSLRGQIRLAKDFDAPLEDFEDYV